MKKYFKKFLSCLLVMVFIISSVNMQVYAAVTSSKNETTILKFLINDMDCNLATAVGILANIQKESNFKPTASVIDTNGLTSYGICQWNGSRFELLKEYCTDKGYDYTTLEGQLNYLKYELKTTEKRAWSKMQGIENTQEGAYLAGYNWARYFERCASVYHDGRGVLARDTYWPHYYNISVPQLSSDKTSYKTSETIKLTRNTLTDTSSYQLIVSKDNKQILSVSMSKSTYTISDLSAGTYTIVLKADQTLSGILESEALTINVTSPFTDVYDYDWYKDYVEEAYNLGIMTGTSDTTFKPNVKMNRGMVAIVLHRIEGNESVAYQSLFSDVNNGEYYSESVTWAKLNGVINGYGNNTFRPLNEVTREEMAQMIYNFASYKGLDVSVDSDLSKFNDSYSVSAWHEDAMIWAVENGIMSGKDNGTRLDPQGSTSRAEACKMLVEVYKLIY